MSLKKISLFLSIFFTTSIFYNPIKAMETDMKMVTQSIQQKLLVLDAAIVKKANELKIAKVQKEKDQLAYEMYEQEWDNKWNKSSFWNRPDYNHNAPEITA